MNMFKKNEKTIIIDCTINVKLPKKMINPMTIDEAMNNQNIHHLITEAKKYNRPNQTINNSQICGESIIEEINKNNITLKAFTFDHFGSLGPQAEKYFYDIKKDNKINDPKALKKFTKQGLKAYNRNNENKQCSNLWTEFFCKIWVAPLFLPNLGFLTKIEMNSKQIGSLNATIVTTNTTLNTSNTINFNSTTNNHDCGWRQKRS